MDPTFDSSASGSERPLRERKVKWKGHEKELKERKKKKAKKKKVKKKKKKESAEGTSASGRNGWRSDADGVNSGTSHLKGRRGRKNKDSRIHQCPPLRSILMIIMFLSILGVFIYVRMHIIQANRKPLASSPDVNKEVSIELNLGDEGLREAHLEAEFNKLKFGNEKAMAAEATKLPPKAEMTKSQNKNSNLAKIPSFPIQSEALRASSSLRHAAVDATAQSPAASQVARSPVNDAISSPSAGPSVPSPMPESRRLDDIWVELLEADYSTIDAEALKNAIRSVQKGGYIRGNEPQEHALTSLAFAYASRISLASQLGIITVAGANVFASEPLKTRGSGQMLLPCIADASLGGVFLDRSLQPDRDDPSQVLDFVKQINEMSSKVWGEMLPPLVTSDDEGGRRSNLPQAYRHWPSLMSVGAYDSSDIAYAYGLGYGQDVHKYGINLIFSPVSDINTEPSNPVIGPRSFGSNPKHVANMVRAVSRGFLDAGVMPTMKHFPGHGATRVDSHKNLPLVLGRYEAEPTDDLRKGKVSDTKSDLRNVELSPYLVAMQTKGNMADGAPVIMSGHILAPGIDKEKPVSISKHALIDVLRGDLGFTGAIVSDALNMRGLTGYLEEKARDYDSDLLIGIEPSIKEKVRAYTAALAGGNDILLDSSFSAQCGAELEEVRRLVLAVSTRKGLQHRMKDAAAHTMLLKLRIWATTRKMLSIKNKETLLRAADPHFRTSVAHGHLNSTEAQTSTVHLWKKDAQQLPLISTQSGQHVVVAYPDSLESAISSFTDYLAGSNGAKSFKGHDVKKIPFRQAASCQDERHVIEEMERGSLGVLFVHNYEVGGDMLIHTIFSEQISMVDAVALAMRKRILTGETRLIVISVENPYDLRYLISTTAGPTGKGSMLASFVALYDSGKLSMERLARDLEDKRNYVDPLSIFDVGLERRPLPSAPLARGRPCPQRQSFKGNDPAKHKNKWKTRPSLRKIVKGGTGKSCADVCKEAGGMQCDALGLYELNSCEKLNAKFNGVHRCAGGCRKVFPMGEYLPCKTLNGDSILEPGTCIVDAELADDIDVQDVLKGQGGPRLMAKVKAYMEPRCQARKDGVQRLCACAYFTKH